MDITFVEKISGGAHGEVWKATDALNRQVAVKALYPDDEAAIDIIEQARALARVSHNNVVRILSVETVPHPDTGDDVQAIIMEFLDGPNLYQRLNGAAFTVGEAMTIGCGIIDGLESIHVSGLTHADLHSENVMLVGDRAVIIDIYYQGSLAALTTRRRKGRLRTDARFLKMLLQDVLEKAGVDQESVDSFISDFPESIDFGGTKQLFVDALNAYGNRNVTTILNDIYRQVTDEYFVESAEYAEALDAETPAEIIPDLLKKLIEERVFTIKHSIFFRTLFTRLDRTNRDEVIKLIGAQLEKDIPDAQWWPNLRLLEKIGPSAWDGLRETYKIRLERMIINGLSSGRHDIYGLNALSSMARLGTHTKYLWRRFQDRERLLSTIETMLQGDWYTQNFIAEHLMSRLPEMVRDADERDSMIDSIVSAMRNKAAVVMSKLEELPNDWVTEIRARLKSR